MPPWLKEPASPYGAVSVEDSAGWNQRHQHWQDLVCDLVNARHYLPHSYAELRPQGENRAGCTYHRSSRQPG